MYVLALYPYISGLGPQCGKTWGFLGARCFGNFTSFVRGASF